ARLSLVLPVRRLAEAGALDDLEAKKRALHPGRRDVDPQQVEDEFLRQSEDLLPAHPFELVREHRRGGGRDRAPLALESDLRDLSCIVQRDLDPLLVSTEGVRVLELQVGPIESAEVVRALVVLEDLLPVEIVHGQFSSKIVRTSSRPSTMRSISSR